MQYLIQPVAHIVIHTCYFVMLLIHVSAPIGRCWERHLQSTTLTINAVQDVQTSS